MRPTIVIYRLGSLGDTVVALPCFHAIARAFPDHRRLALTNIPVSSKAPALEAVLGTHALIHGSLNYPLGVRSPAAILLLARRLRALRADALVYLTENRGALPLYRDALFFRLCGFSRFLGMPWTRDLRENRRMMADEEPEAQKLARSLHALGPIDLDDPANWDLMLTSAERAAGKAALAPFQGRPIIAINMGGKVLEKDWGDRNWHALTAMVGADLPDHGLVVVGATDDRHRADQLRASWPGAFANLCGELAPREAAAALGHARCFVGHDSGPLHLAAAMQVPCVGLYGSCNQPRRWHPYGAQHRIIHDVRGVRAIDVSNVHHRVREVMAAEDVRSGLHVGTSR